MVKLVCPKCGKDGWWTVQKNQPKFIPKAFLVESACGWRGQYQQLVRVSGETE